jgi:hypothetical protein
VVGPATRAWRLIDARLDRGRIRFVCAVVLLLSTVLVVISFATAEGGVTAFGPPLGADFAGFYNAGTILNLSAPSQRDRLYDFRFQDELYHGLLPGLTREKTLPFVHPPFVALFFSYLARLPYEVAVAIWLAVSGVMYLTGVMLVRGVLRAQSELDWPTVVLLALSFEPFIMECWIGGQLSAVGFLCVILALRLEHAGRCFTSGMALGLLLYKPTLLVLILPMLVISQRWRSLLGLMVTGALFAALSYAGAGRHNCMEYAEVLFGFARMAAGEGGLATTGTLEIPLWKYVDLNSFFRLLVNARGVIHWMLFTATAVAPLSLLIVAWWKTGAREWMYRRLVWAGTLTGTLIINLYVGIYDTVLIVPAVLLTADAVIYPATGELGKLTSGFRALVLALYAVPWFTQPLARQSGLQTFTLVLLLALMYQLVTKRVDRRHSLGNGT